MELTPIIIDLDNYPEELKPVLSGAKVYDSSSSPEARVIFIDKEEGYFLKSAKEGKLKREALMTEYFYNKGLAAEVLTYISHSQNDWLLTAKVKGDDCTASKYLDKPESLCDLLAERLSMLHSEDYSNCPVKNHTEIYLNQARYNKQTGNYNKSHFPDSFGYKNAEEALEVLELKGHLLKTDTLLHGDYCLPNIILNNWRLSGFIDLDNAGVGDRHADIFWALWSLNFNFKTDKYRKRFTDAYGRDKVDEEKLRIVAAAEVFG